MKTNETAKLKANYTITRAPQALIDELLAKHKPKNPEKWLAQNLKNIEDPRIIRSKAHNLVPDVTLYALASRFAGDDLTTYTFEVNKIVLGDDATPATAGDTALGNETVRGNWTATTADEKTAYLDKYFSSSEVGGQTFLEAGMLIGGADGVGGVGLLVSHVNIDETLSSTETLSINATITFNSAT